MNSTTSDRRRTVALWGAGAAAATVLVLGVNGTLGAWTEAIITNDNNTTSAPGAVALSESSGGAECVDTAETADNTATCSTINKYGGTTTPLTPGSTVTTSVTLMNTGTLAGDLTLDAQACTNSGGAAGSAGNLCDEVQVTVECPTGTTTYGPATLTAFDTAAASPVVSLAAGASIDCDITVTLPLTAPTEVAGMTASQPLVWTLTA